MASDGVAAKGYGRGLRALVEQMPCVVWATDRDLRITQAMGHHDAWTVAGLDRDHAVGASISQVLGCDDPRDPVLAAHAAALRGEGGSLHYRLRGHWYDLHLEPLRATEDEITGCLGSAIDVTERESAREDAQRTTERLDEAQRIAHVGNWEWTVTDNRVTWSPELLRIYGLERGGFAGTYEAFLERVFPEDREQTRAIVFEAYRTVKPFTYEHRIVRPDGTIRMLYTRGGVVADEYGKVIRMVGACWDITELTDARKQSERARSLLAAALESTADGLLVVDLRGTVVAHNHRLMELWQLPDRDVDGRDFSALLAEVHDRPANGDELEVQADAETLESLRSLDGRFFERYSRPQRIGAETVGRVWSYRDVTERERLLRSALLLADASRLLASLDEPQALEAVAQLSLPYLGEACAIDLFDGAPHRIVSVSRPNAPSIATEVPHAAQKGNPLVYRAGDRSCVTVPILAHGEAIGALSFAAPAARTYSDADLSIVSELARRIELSLENTRLYRQAQEALAARDEFLGIAAHEIRGPLTALQLAVQGLPSAKDQRQAKLLAIVERETRRLARFVDEIFDVTRARSGQLAFAFARVDLVQVTREVMDRMALDIQRSGSPVQITTPASLSGTWDRARLAQVVTDLLANAVKFGLGKPIEIKIDSDGRDARWSVTDHGIGIPLPDQGRIFSPFERVVSARHYGGLGLGLFIVRSIVDALDGTIAVQSQPGAGTTFTVLLPLERPA
jgi:PAS domain S-box-containing protein